MVCLSPLGGLGVLESLCLELWLKRKKERDRERLVGGGGGGGGFGLDGDGVRVDASEEATMASAKSLSDIPMRGTFKLGREG
jgi:hypothetical protein